MLKVFIDESGNLGTKGRFFIIAALATNNGKRIKNLSKRKLIKLKKAGYPLNELKASNLSFPQKQDILTDLCNEDDFQCFYVVADKKHLVKKILEDKNICYNYLCKFLFENIIKGTTDDVSVILDNHSIKTKALNSLCDYIKIHAYTDWGFNKSIIFEYKDSEKVKNLQIIDIISNAIYAKYMYNKNHLYDLIRSKINKFTEFPYSKFNS